MEKFIKLPIQNEIVSSTTDGIPAGSNDLIDSTADFVTDGVAVGDFVVDLSGSGNVATVEAVVDLNNLTLSDSVTVSSGSAYLILSGTNSTAELLPISDILYVERNNVYSLDIHYNVAGGNNDIITLYHSRLAAGSQAGRYVLQDTIVKAFSKVWQDVAIEPVNPLNVKFLATTYTP